MKLTKNLFWAFAGLGLVACSGEEIVPQGSDMDGNAVVEVTIAAPNDFNRSLVAGTTGADAGAVKVNGTLTIKLEAEIGSGTYTIDLSQESARGTITRKFWGVKNPKKVMAYINDGDKVNNDTKINNLSAPNMQAEPEEIPAYGESSSFTLSGKTEVNSEDGKTYEMYDANVKMEIPVARLEVSNIKHVDKEGATCKYSALSIDGIYLDKVLVTKGASSVTDYCYPPAYGADGQTVVVPAPVLWDQIAAPNDFMDYAAKWPASATPEQAFAYNFYPSEGQQPILKIYFASATSSDPNNIVAQPRYAMVKTYNNDPDFKFEAGKIYRITSVNLNDDNIIGDEEGNTLYGVNVNVEEAEWTIADISAEWTE